MDHPMFWLYAFTRLDGFKGFLVAAIVLVFVVAIFGAIVCALNTDTYPYSEEKAAEWEKRAWRALKLLYIVPFLSLLLVLIPSQRDVAIMLGGSLAVDAIKSPVVAATAGKVNALIQGTLDNAIKDLKKPKENDGEEVKK